MTLEQFVTSQLAVLRAQKKITADRPEAQWRDELTAAYSRIDWTAEPEPEPEPTEEWADKELFISALYALVPAATVAAVMQSPDALKAGIAGLALLTTNAAPNGMIDLKDSRVAEFAGLLGLTVEAVKAKMDELQNPSETPPEEPKEEANESGI